LSAAYFDVDGTLVDSNLIQPTIYFLGNQASPWQSAGRLGRALLHGPLMAMAEVRDRRLFNEMLYGHYRGMTEDRLVCLGEEIFEEVLLPRMFRGSVALIDKCKRAGFRVVLVTGSLDFTTRPLAKYLGADRIISNRLEMREGKATGKLKRPIVAGPQKSGLIVADAKEHGHDLADCCGYSDSFSDVPMLSVVGHPACINPDKKLTRLAKAYDWPILEIDRPARGESTRHGGTP